MGRILIDSNVIIKYFAGETDIEWVLAEEEAYYNVIVFSEVLYTLIRAKTGLKPYDIKRDPSILRRIGEDVGKVKKFFKEHMILLQITDDVVERAARNVTRHELLPNDAIILATAEEYGLNYLITYDQDLLRLRDVEVEVKTPEKILRNY